MECAEFVQCPVDDGEGMGFLPALTAAAPAAAGAVGSIINAIRPDKSAEKAAKAQAAAEVKQAQIARIVAAQQGSTNLYAVMGVGAIAVAALILWQSGKGK